MVNTMELSMSQLGYMYSKAVQKYGGAFNMKQDSSNTFEAIAAVKGEKSVQGAGEFLAKSSYEMDPETRAEQMAAYTSYLYEKMQTSVTIETLDTQSELESVKAVSYRRATSRREAMERLENTQIASNSTSKVTENEKAEETEKAEESTLTRDPADILCGESIISDFSYGKHQLDYLFSYDEKGMSCIALYSGEEMWSMEFEDSSQYESVKEFLSTMDPEDNLTFTANDSFWKRFLDGNIDLDDFRETLTHLENGKLDLTEKNANGKLIAIEYMNIFINPGVNIFRNFRAFPSFEAAIMDQHVSSEYSLAGFFGDHEKYTEYFYKANPELIGVKAFWNWMKNEWCTLEDMLDVWDQSEKDKPHYSDKREQAIEEYYKKYPEDKGIKKYMIHRSMDKDPEMVTFEEHYDWNAEQNGPAGPLMIKRIMGEGDYWKWLNRHKTMLATMEEKESEADVA